MPLILLAKLAGTVVGIATLLLGKLPPFLGLAVLGILPVWLEAITTAVTGVEPGREFRPGWKLLDLLVDGISFIFVPVSAFAWLAQGRLSTAMYAVLAAFAVCGGFRIARFYWKGLLNDQYFEGVPVTFTGYLWWVVLALAEKGHEAWAVGIVALEALAMVSTWIRIPASGRRAPLDRRATAR